jgi:ABC-2 type transport system permease protein
MREFIIAFYCELTKVLKSKMLLGTSIFFAFIGIMLAFIMLVAKHPEIAGGSEILTAKASFISNPNWTVYFGLLLQMVLTIGGLGPSIVAIWVFGREYSDRVIKDLLALPVSRQNIVLAKFLVVFLWSLLLLLLLFVFSLLCGFLIHLDGWNYDLFLQKARIYSISAFLTIILFPVISLITCINRGYLLPVGFSILFLIATQFVFIGIPGVSPYFPWAIPGLFSGVAGPVAPEPKMISYVILGLTSVLGIAGTAAWWRFADQH